MKTHHLLAYISTGLWLMTAILVLYGLFGATNPPVELVVSEVCTDEGVCSDNVDVIQIALQLGRLDLITYVLTILGGVLALFAIFGFLAVKEKAEIVAHNTALRAASEKVEAWINSELPKVIARQVDDWFAINVEDMAKSTADEIANVYANEDEK